MVIKLKTLLRKVAWLIIRLTSLIIPKDPRRWVFQSNPAYDGNSRALYEYVREFHPDIDPVWFLYSDTDSNVISSLNRDGALTAQMHSFRRLYYLMTAQVIISTHHLVPTKTSRRQIAVNLWHGMPIKAIGLLENRNLTKHGKKQLARGASRMNITIATSAVTRSVLSMQLGIPPDQIYITGQPRTDYFNACETEGRAFLAEFLGIAPAAKIIFMLPTFRVSKSFNLYDGTSIGTQLNDPEALLDLNSSLRELNSHLIIKPHPHDGALPELFSETENIHLLPDQALREAVIDLYTLLSISDVLVTDYSSVFIDYLLLDRPMVFFIQDIYQYQETRPFVYEPFDFWTPGEKVSSVGELHTAITSILRGSDSYWERRRDLRDVFHKYADAGASERIVRLIKEML